MAAFTAGERVRVVIAARPWTVARMRCAWRDVVFHVKLYGLGTHFFESQELERRD